MTSLTVSENIVLHNVDGGSMGVCKRGLPATPRCMRVGPATYFALTARAGMTSACGLRNASQRRDWEVCIPTKVGLALEHVPALDSYPTLRRNPPLSREQVLFFKDFTGVPSASQDAPLPIEGVSGLGAR